MTVGCDHNRNKDFGHWSKVEVERMEIDEIESVPLFVVRF